MANRKMASLFFIVLLFSVQANAVFRSLTAQDLEDDISTLQKVPSAKKVVKLKKMLSAYVNGQLKLMDASSSNQLAGAGSGSHEESFEKIYTVWVFGD